MLRALLTAALAVACPASALAQLNPGEGKTVPRETTLSLEIITGEFGAGVRGQDWSRDLAKLGYSVRIRAAKFDEVPGVEETLLGRTRTVRVVGLLDRGGALVFPKKKFQAGESAKLVEWLRELQTYGAEGSPEGKPMWGLTQAQFEDLFTSLGPPIEADLGEKSLDECLAAIPSDRTYPLVWSQEAKEQRAKQADTAGTFPEWQQVEGMARGSGLSLVLGHFGLGFRPSRTPAGGIELIIEPIAVGRKQWPIGWPGDSSPDLLAPKFVATTQVSLDQVPLLDVAQAISVQTETPVVFHMPSIRAKQLRLEDLKVSHPPRRRNWSLVLAYCLSQHELVQKLHVDEAGKPFVLIRTKASLADEPDK